MKIRPMERLYRAVLLGISLFALAACSGSSSSTTPDDLPRDPSNDAINWSEYEDFDASAYADEVPEQVEDLVHDVPESLMGGRAEQGMVQRVQGFRVQIFNSIDRDKAVQEEEAAQAWWRSLAGSERPARLWSDTLPTYTDYRQPYYRIRVGDFTTRADAERALNFVKRRFPDAFIAPDVVTIVR
jgi:hypothetical protein